MKKLNFEIKEELENEIKDLKKRIEEIRPKCQKELEETHNFDGKYSLTRRKLIANLQAKEKELKELIIKMKNNHELMEDPVKKVRDKYKNKPANNECIKLAMGMINQIRDVMYNMQEFQKIIPRYGFSYPMDLHGEMSRLSVMQRNLLHLVEYQMRPMTNEGYKKELNEAQEKVKRLRKEQKERLDLEASYRAN